MPNLLLELWNEPAIRFLLGFTAACALLYWIWSAIFETIDRQRVIAAAEQWAANKRIRHNRTTEGKELWDSVNQLKRGQRQQRNEWKDKAE